MFKTKEKGKKGFTLLEMMVALAIFLMVSLVSVSIFVTAVQNQRRDFMIQNLQDNARYIMEAFSKEVRMSEIRNTNGDATRLNIKNQDYIELNYEFTSSDLLRGINPLNSTNVSVQGGFYVIKSGEQPRVTIKMILTPAGSTEPKIQVQNTVTSRKY